MSKTLIFTEAKVSREELPLPTAYFIVADDWVDKLGAKAYCTWLKFYSWCDRRDKERDYDKIPQSLEGVAERLGMSKSTLYRTILKPLWNYGLIDLVEFEESSRRTQKPVNIIVYRYPQNNKTLETKPLEKVREYDTDYNSQAQIFAKRGGRPKGEMMIRANGEPHKSYRFKNKTVTVSKMKPINKNIKYINNNINNNKDIIIDDDKRSASQMAHNEEDINLIINNFRESTKNELQLRSFKAVVRKVIDKYNQGKVNSFRDYLATSLSNKIYELELRRMKDEVRAEIQKSKKEIIQERKKEFISQPISQEVAHYNWLDKGKD